MSKSETLRIMSIEPPLEEGGDSVVYAADKRTGEEDLVEINEISINNKSITTEYFSAVSLGRRVRGYYTEADTTLGKGEIDIVTPLAAGESEQF